MGCGSSRTTVSQAKRDALEVQAAGAGEEEEYSSSEEGESSNYDDEDETGTEGGSGDELGEEVRQQEPTRPVAEAISSSSIRVKKARQRRSSVELFKARQPGGEGGPAAQPAPRRLGDEAGPDLDEGVASLVNSWLQSCVAGDATKLWALLAPAMQEQLAFEAEAQEPPTAPQDWCVAKNSWDWPESRGRFLRMRVSSFDGHMCGVRSTFDTGLLQVDYRDVLWLREGRITATKSASFLTHAVRRELVRPDRHFTPPQSFPHTIS